MAKNNVAKKGTAAKATPKKVTTEVTTPVVIPKVHPLVVFLVAFHVLAITIYALPKPMDAVMEGKVEPNIIQGALAYNQKVIKESSPIYGYLLPTGFWQYWDMFAPDPAQTDYWSDAEVTYLLGQTKTFSYPHIKNLSLGQKFIYERHRKFYERVNMDTVQAAYLRATFAQSIAFQMADDPQNPPVKVVVTTHFLPVPRHDKPVAAEPPYSKILLIAYVVDQHKLFADKGWKLGIH